MLNIITHLYRRKTSGYVNGGNIGRIFRHLQFVAMVVMINEATGSAGAQKAPFSAGAELSETNIRIRAAVQPKDRLAQQQGISLQDKCTINAV